MKGLVQAERKNMERMAEAVLETDAQTLQNFLSNSPWDPDAVLARWLCVATMRWAR